MHNQVLHRKGDDQLLEVQKNIRISTQISKTSEEYAHTRFQIQNTFSGSQQFKHLSYFFLKSVTKILLAYHYPIIRT